MQYKTFVCDMCKTSHQAISHRCKSVAMSTWTVDEVKSLTTQGGGGNEVALHVWLSRAPAYGQRYNGGYRPKQGDKIEVFKQFVIDCYEKEMFKGTTPFQPAAVPAASAAPAANAAAAPPRQAAATRAAPAPSQPSIDFFSDDFGAAQAPPQSGSSFGQGFASGISIIAPSVTAPPSNSGGGSDSPWSQKMKSSDPFADFNSSSSPNLSQKPVEDDFFGGSGGFVSSPAVVAGSSPLAVATPPAAVDPFSTAFAAPAPIQAPPAAPAASDPFGSDVLFPMAPASAGAFTSSPLAAGPASGAARPVQSYQQQQAVRPAMNSNSGLAISSLMDPTAPRPPPAIMGYRGAVPAPGSAQKADSFDFVKDSMGINRSISASSSPAMSISGMGPSYIGAGAPMQPAISRNASYPPAPAMMGGGMGMTGAGAPGMYSAQGGSMMGQPGWPNQQQYRR